MSQVSILILHVFSVFSLTDSQHGDSPGFERAETSAEPQQGKVQSDWKAGLTILITSNPSHVAFLFNMSSIAAMGPMISRMFF